MDTPKDERRRFSRIPFEASVSLAGPKGKWMGKLLDISLNGVLVSHPSSWVDDKEHHLMLEIHPPGDPYTIRMEAVLMHSTAQHLGFRCAYIDLDSISHLRRLIELNVGNDDILNRELSELVVA